MKKKVVILINVDWFLISHFSNYVKMLVSKGVDVTIISAETDCAQKIKNLGADFLPLKIDRGYSGLFSEIKSFLRILLLLMKTRPDVVECISVKSIVYGGIIARLLFNKKSFFFYVSGLGFAFSNSGTIKSKIKSLIFKWIYKIIFKSKTSSVIVENNDDFNFVLSCGGDIAKTYVVNGVGVDLNKFKPNSNKFIEKYPIKILMVSRLLFDKGIQEFVDCAKKIILEYSHVEFFLAGDVDKSNPLSADQQWIDKNSNLEKITLLGKRSDIAELMRDSNIFVLPSYREGFPKVIMEAAASGMAIITTNVPGCREAIVKDVTGLLVESKDSSQLYQALKFFIEKPENISLFAKRARSYAFDNFDENKISEKHLKIILESSRSE